MEQRIEAALAIDKRSPATERTVDITTAGARTGRPRRIEIWFHRVDGRYYLSSFPARPGWYANLRANPRFTFHLKHGVRADLEATAVPVSAASQRRAVLRHITDDLNQPHNPGRITQPALLDEWMAGSPLIEVVFDD
jgi:deazaflavin-dependent oxidoreductase (nitroreductase family)